MEGERQIRDTLYDILGEEGCGMACEDDADIFFDEEGWKLMLCGFMEPWKLGDTVEQAKAALETFGSMGYGLA